MSDQSAVQGYIAYNIESTVLADQIGTDTDQIHVPIIDARTTYRLEKYGHAIYFYRIRCSNAECGEQLYLYQKDGPGPLLRCYADRISEQTEAFGLTTLNGIKCRMCDQLISRPMSWYIKDDGEYHEKRHVYEMRF